MGDGDKENDLLYYNDVFDECLLVRDFIDRSDYEKCSIIQDMESILETAFIIYADAEADSEYDIGWRTGYRMTGWHICAIPFDSDHLDDEELAKDIISCYRYRTAFTDGKETLTYLEPDAESAKVYRFLKNKGIGRETFVTYGDKLR